MIRYCGLFLLIIASQIAHGGAKGAAEPQTAQHATAAPSENPKRGAARDPRIAMDTFTGALANRNLTALLSCFSRTSHWTLVTTELDADPLRHDKRKTDTFSYKHLSKTVRPGGEFAEFFFDGDDPFVHFVETTRGKPWRAIDPLTFVPDSTVPLNPPAFVRWRLEGGRYVIDEIGTPMS